VSDNKLSSSPGDGLRGMNCCSCEACRQTQKRFHIRV
jgi:hypothetical protein